MKIFSLVTVMLFSAMLLFTGCKKEAEKPEVPAEQPKVEQPQAPEPEQVAERVPDLKGTWKGTFYNKSMTLFIGEQIQKEFEGETTVNWAKPLTMKVKGSFNPETGRMTFADQSSTKDAGTYEGTLSADYTTFTGKFTLNSGGKKFDVKLSLK
ncbi:MAG TPA: hypothetical protein PK397_07810 [Ignavibacteriaceae bacterium]|nr:hypothetical protein [Ignavibacteriaceae bacterium]